VTGALAIDAAFEDGELEATRGALDDPAVILDGPLPAGFGRCLLYAIDHRPVALIGTRAGPERRPED